MTWGHWQHLPFDSFGLLPNVADGHQNIRIPSSSTERGVRTFLAYESCFRSRDNLSTNMASSASSIVDLRSACKWGIYNSIMSNQWPQRRRQCISDKGWPGGGRPTRYTTATHWISGHTLRGWHQPPLCLLLHYWLITIIKQSIPPTRTILSTNRTNCSKRAPSFGGENGLEGINSWGIEKYFWGEQTTINLGRASTSNIHNITNLPQYYHCMPYELQKMAQNIDK